MRGRGDSGFSLIEVVVALGLLAGVLISVAGLFILAGRSVKSGRTSSEALAAGKEIVEQMNGWGFPQLWGQFGFDGQAATYTVDTATCVTAECTAWKTALQAKLGNTAHATIKIDSVSQTGVVTPNFANAGGTTLAKNVRLTVSVGWTQVMGRTRTVSVVTTRN